MIFLLPEAGVEVEVELGVMKVGAEVEVEAEVKVGVMGEEGESPSVDLHMVVEGYFLMGSPMTTPRGGFLERG